MQTMTAGGLILFYGGGLKMGETRSKVVAIDCPSNREECQTRRIGCFNVSLVVGHLNNINRCRGCAVECDVAEIPHPERGKESAG